MRAERWQGKTGTLVVFTIMLGAITFAASFPELVPGTQIFSEIVQQIGMPWLPAVASGASLVATVIVANMSSASKGRAKRSRREARLQLARAAYQGALEVLEKRRGRQGLAMTGAGQQYSGFNFPAPAPRYGRTTPQDAEDLAAEWMRHLGETSARSTQYSGDGGVDVEGHFYLAQVKHFSSNVGVAPVRELAGVIAADPRGRRGLFFTSTGYAPGAIDFANRTDIALFRYDEFEGTLHAINQSAMRYYEQGLTA